MVRFLAVAIFSLFAITNGFNIQPRIFNGDLSNAEDFPFYVAIEIWGEILCGGTIISDRWILTAAHCLHGINREICFSVNSTGGCRARIPVSKQHVHPLYHKKTNLNDIALLELPTPIAFNEFIQPAKLSTACDIPHLGGQDVTAIGMGGTAHGQYTYRSGRRLRQADFVTKSAHYCATEIIKDAEFYANYYGYDNLREDQLYGMTCIEPNYARNQSTFRGDSGGPMILKDSGAYTALTSFHVDAHTSPTGTSLHVFIYVPYYYEWIERRTGLEMPKCNGPQADAFV